MRYVVLTDGSELAKAAAQLCAAGVKPNDEVILYSCFISTTYYPGRGQAESHKEFINDVEGIFTGIEGITVNKVLQGTPHDTRKAILKFLDEYQPDVVFMGTHGYGDVHAAISSTSQYLLHHYEQGATVLCRGLDPKRIKHSLAYLLFSDGSEQSLRAARVVAILARPNDSITIVCNEKQPSQYTEGCLGAPTAGFASDWKILENKEYDKESIQATELAQINVQKAKEVILRTNASIKHIIEDPSVAEQPLEKSVGQAQSTTEVYDVVAMGTRGRGLIKRVALGSFSTHLIHHVKNKAFLVVH